MAKWWDNWVASGKTPLPSRVDWKEKGLGREYRQDLRSLNFLVRGQIPVENFKQPRSFTWSVPITLDQGPDGACVGFGYSHELAARPQSVTGIDYYFALNLYYKIQQNDPWPGGAYPDAEEFYEGTSVLTGAQTLRSLGYYTSYYWALTAKDVAAGIGYKGPAVLGLNWHEGMFEPDADGFITDSGSVVGGHCVVAPSVTIKYKFRLSFWRTRTWDDVDWDKSYITIHNSWGPSWGDNGNAKIRLSTLAGLLSRQGEAMFPVRSNKVTV